MKYLNMKIYNALDPRARRRLSRIADRMVFYKETFWSDKFSPRMTRTEWDQMAVLGFDGVTGKVRHEPRWYKLDYKATKNAEREIDWTVTAAIRTYNEAVAQELRILVRGEKGK